MHAVDAKTGNKQGDVAQIPRQPAIGGTHWQAWKAQIRMFIGGTANRLGFPGCIQSVVFDDPVTDQRIEVRLGLLFTIVSVNGRDYYFRRFSGVYDGAGMGCSNRSVCYRLGHIPGSNASPRRPCRLLPYQRSE